MRSFSPFSSLRLFSKEKIKLLNYLRRLFVLTNCSLFNEASKVRRLMITSVSGVSEYKYCCLLGSGGTIGWYKFTTVCEDAALVFRVEHFYHTVRYHVPTGQQ